VALGPGDPVYRTSTGGIQLSFGSENANSASAPVGVFGIVMGVQPYYDSAQGVRIWNSTIPSGVNYGTNLERQTKVLVMPVEWGVWEVDCTSSAVVSTLSGYQSMGGANAYHKLDAGSSDGRAKPILDIATSATTASAYWRILGVSPNQFNQDYTGRYIKMLVEINNVSNQRPGYSSTVGI
jgi:hypothetical protein